ncbi:MAG: hypothetical protein OSB14_10810 [Planctomycetota bacterium]|nr:hypothetical protein [Planctomycetota bacterium]
MASSKLSPYCHDLITKKRWFIQRPPVDESDLLDGSGACWCRQTKDAIGPDRGIVDPEDCQEGRGCWKRWGSPSELSESAQGR